MKNNAITRRRPMLWGIGLLTVGFSYGFLSHRHQIFPYGLVAAMYRAVQGGEEARAGEVSNPPGFWMSAAATAQTLTSEQQAQLDRVSALGYLGGYADTGNVTGVLVYDSARAEPGYNFYTSGHAPEAVLMTMDGEVVHRWQYARWHEWHEGTSPLVVGDYWRRASLLPNGDILAIYEGLGMIKLDRDSRLVWEYRGAPHHDLDVRPDGSIYVLTRDIDKRHPGVWGGEPIFEDFVTILDSHGNEVRRVSLVRAFANSEYSSYLDAVTVDDIFHTNTVEVLDGRLARRSPAFRAGNVLVCLRNIDAIAVVDLEQERIVWAQRGMWRMPHQPTVLSTGNILLFDNRGLGGKSKVIEFDPFTQEIFWAFRDEPQRPFESSLMGSNQRLSGGNTLIAESTRGRVFEVTPGGEVVWEFVNPQRAGERRELIAVIPEMVRVAPHAVQSWLR